MFKRRKFFSFGVVKVQQYLWIGFLSDNLFVVSLHRVLWLTVVALLWSAKVLHHRIVEPQSTSPHRADSLSTAAPLLALQRCSQSVFPLCLEDCVQAEGPESELKMARNALLCIDEEHIYGISVRSRISWYASNLRCRGDPISFPY